MQKKESQHFWKKENLIGKINKLYNELNVLLPPEIPNFDDGGDQRVDRDEDGNWVGSYQYYLNNSISAPQANPTEASIEEE